jgi:hypothetical protein
MADTIPTNESMKKDVWRPEWHKVTNTEAHQVTGSTLTPGQVFSYPTGKLPSQLLKLPGLYASYISGYATGSISPEHVTVLGEVAAVRSGEGKGKGYVWAFGISGDGVYINGPYKFFDGHHFDDTASVPVAKLFGNVPPYPSPPPPLPPPTTTFTGQAVPPSQPPAAGSKTAKASFVVFEPTATKVYLSGEFNGWTPDAMLMTRRNDGIWETTVELAPGRYQYKFIVDGQWKHDPSSRENVANVYGTLNSVIEVSA